MLKQVLNTGKRTGAEAEEMRMMLRRTADMFPSVDLDRSPAHNSTRAVKLVPEATGVADPYRREKREYNARALSLRPLLERIMEGSERRLETAALIAVAGNVIDLGIADGGEVNVEASLRAVMTEGFAINDVEVLAEELSVPRRVAYLADNSGEVVFDRELVRELRDAGHSVTVLVHGGPILNDALLEDAQEAGLAEVGRIVSTGSDWIGFEPDTVSLQAQEIVRSAEVVVAKGQGNYETVSGNRSLPGAVFFLLKAKCWPVARSLGVPLGRVVCKKGRN